MPVFVSVFMAKIFFNCTLLFLLTSTIAPDQFLFSNNSSSSSVTGLDELLYDRNI